MSKTRKLLICFIPVLLLLCFTAYAVFSPRADISSVTGAAVYLILFASAVLACIKGFLDFFKKPDAPSPCASLGERSKKRLHPLWKLFFYSVLAQILFVIVSYALNNAVNGFHDTIFEWYTKAFTGGTGTDVLNAFTAAEKLAFIPFLPYFAKFFTGFAGGAALPAFILNTIFFACASVALYELMLCDYDKKSAVFAVALLHISPTAVYAMLPFGAVSLFLLVMLLMFLLLRGGKLIAAGVFAMLAAATNIMGVLLIIPLLMEGIRACISAKQAEGSDKAETEKTLGEKTITKKTLGEKNITKKTSGKKTSRTAVAFIISLLPLIMLFGIALIVYFRVYRFDLPCKYLYPNGFRHFFEVFHEPIGSIMNGRFTWDTVYALLPLFSCGIILAVCLNKIRASWAAAALLIFAFVPTVLGRNMTLYGLSLFPMLPILFGAAIQKRKFRNITGLITFAFQLLFIAAVFVRRGI